jgi:hypothetical protein
VACSLLSLISTRLDDYPKHPALEMGKKIKETIEITQNRFERKWAKKLEVRGQAVSRFQRDI